MTPSPDQSSNQTKPRLGQTFWIQWVLGNTLGHGVGLALPLFLAELKSAQSYESYLVAAIFSFSVWVGLAQWIMLRKPLLVSADWIWITAASPLSACVLALPFFYISKPLVLLSLIIYPLLVGIWQWIILRRIFRPAKEWIITCSIAGVLGELGGAVFGNVYHGGFGQLTISMLIGGLCFGLIYGLITGIGLRHLSQQEYILPALVERKKLLAKGNFSQFKGRYILLDIVFVFAIICTLLGTGAFIAGVNQPELVFKDPILSRGVSLLIALAICFRIFHTLKKQGIQPKYLFGGMHIQGLPWLMLFSVFYGIQTLKQGISQLTIFFTNLISPSLAKTAIEDAMIQYTYDSESLVLKILYLILIFVGGVIIAPLTEEFLFRGVVLHYLTARWGVMLGVIASSLLFGLAHVNIYAPAIGISYLFVALIYIKTKTLTVPIVFHLMNNLIAFISGVVNLFLYSSVPTEITLQTLWSGLLNTAFAIPILFYFLKFPTRFEVLPYSANLESQQRTLQS
jgi:uncharacterized protein